MQIADWTFAWAAGKIKAPTAEVQSFCIKGEKQW